MFNNKIDSLITDLNGLVDKAQREKELKKILDGVGGTYYYHFNNNGEETTLTNIQGDPSEIKEKVKFKSEKLIDDINKTFYNKDYPWTLHEKRFKDPNYFQVIKQEVESSINDMLKNKEFHLFDDTVGFTPPEEMPCPKHCWDCPHIDECADADYDHWPAEEDDDCEFTIAEGVIDLGEDVEVELPTEENEVDYDPYYNEDKKCKDCANYMQCPHEACVAPSTNECCIGKSEVKKKVITVPMNASDEVGVIYDIPNDPNSFLSLPANVREGSYYDLISRMVRTYFKKNKDYGDTAHRLYQKHGIDYYRIMLEQKLLRVNEVAGVDNPHCESLEDSLLDLANYAILAVESLKRDK